MDMDNDAKLTYGVIAGLVVVLLVLAYFLQGNLSVDDMNIKDVPIQKNTIKINSTSTQPTASSTATTTATTTMTTPEKITTAVLTTNKGVVEFEFSSATPLTVQNFIKLSQAGFYNGTRFHRVIRDFMIQGGDPLSKDVSKRNIWGTGGPGYSFKDETTPNDKMVQGVVAMANSGPNTNGSQFFIITASAGTPWLVGKHTPFARVTKGMDVVLKIQDVQVNGQDQPMQDIIVEKVEVK